MQTTEYKRFFDLDPCYIRAVTEDPVEQAWSRVQSAWEDDEAHRRFLKICLALDRLPEAGWRYRKVQETDPTRKDDAERRIEALISVATEKLTETRADKFQQEAPKRNLTMFAFILMGALMGVAIWLMLRGGI